MFLEKERNALIFAALQEVIKSGAKSVAMVYGAAHGYSIEPRIVSELGFRHRSTTWHDALVLHRR